MPRAKLSHLFQFYETILYEKSTTDLSKLCSEAAGGTF